MAHFTAAAADVVDTIAPAKPTRVNGFHEFLLWPLGSPKWAISWVGPFVFPFSPDCGMRPMGEVLLERAVKTVYDLMERTDNADFAESSGGLSSTKKRATEHSCAEATWPPIVRRRLIG